MRAAGEQHVHWKQELEQRDPEVGELQQLFKQGKSRLQVDSCGLLVIQHSQTKHLQTCCEYAVKRIERNLNPDLTCYGRLRHTRHAADNYINVKKIKWLEENIFFSWNNTYS